MNPKYTIEQIKEIARSRRWECLSKEYKPKDKLKWRCFCGCEFGMVLHAMKRGNPCPQCYIKWKTDKIAARNAKYYDMIAKEGGEHKKCMTCNKTKHISEFGVIVRRDKTPLLKSRCRDCALAIGKEYYNGRKKKVPKEKRICEYCQKAFRVLPVSKSKTCVQCRASISSVNGRNLTKEHLFRLMDDVSNDRGIGEVISGSLLGDGCIVKASPRRPEGHTSNFSISIGSVSPEYLNWLKGQLDSEFKIIGKKIYVSPEGIFKGKGDGKVYHTQKFYGYSFNNNIIFSQVRNRWYIDKEKIVPEDLTLSPKICSIWYMDDGCKSSKTSIYLSTHNFNKKNIDLLESKIYKYIGIKPKQSIPYTKTNGEPAITLGFRNSAMYDFFDYIGKCPVDYFKYKWPK